MKCSHNVLTLYTDRRTHTNRQTKTNTYPPLRRPQSNYWWESYRHIRSYWMTAYILELIVPTPCWFRSVSTWLRRVLWTLAGFQAC